MQPSGTLHIGNYLGALKQWVAAQSADAFYCVVDLHALTLEIEPETLRSQSYDLIATYLAAGLDPEVCTIFLQSEVPYHAQINWLLECVATYGELSRMTQFKEKSSRKTGYRVGLLTYPVLMAGDILLYETAEVPVGDDQRQHLELTRVIAERFNNRYGPTFVVPVGVQPKVAARVMDLQEPTRKMSKSISSPLGLDLRHRLARRDRQEDQEGGHRHRRRGPLRLGEEARHLEPARDLLQLQRRVAAGGRRALHALRRFEERPLGAGHRVARPRSRMRYDELMADPTELRRGGRRAAR